MSSKKFIAGALVTGLVVGGAAYYVGYQYGKKEGTEMWDAIKAEDIERMKARKIAAIMATGQCPKCEYDKFEIDYSIVSEEEHGYCPECNYYEVRKIGTNEVQSEYLGACE